MKNTNKICRAIAWGSALLLHFAPIYMIFSGGSKGHAAAAGVLLLILMAADCLLMTVFDSGSKRSAKAARNTRNNFFKELYRSSQIHGRKDMMTGIGNEFS